MRIILILIAVVSAVMSARGQKVVKEIKKTIEIKDIESKLRFLASDEMRGRDTGSPELNIAAMYIAEQFRSFGVATAGSDTYFQPVKLVKKEPAKEASITIGDIALKLREDFVIREGRNTKLTAPVMFLNYGLKEDFEGKEVKGKILIVRPGTPEIDNPRKYWPVSVEKQQMAQDYGAVALIELYRSNAIPWKLLANYLSQSAVRINKGNNDGNMLFIWAADPEGKLENLTKNYSGEGVIAIAGIKKEKIVSKNVVGWLEGADPAKKDEYLVLSAHYDHVGVSYKGPEQDSIFNGARDNAIGTTTLLETARFLSKNRPNRSVVFLAFTGEEKGLLGSKWYTDHPIFPLEQSYFNFNTDGAGYNSKEIVTVIGLNRTSAAENIKKATAIFGLEAQKDPVPEQNLFDRSDNANFAKQGVPAITFAPGVTAFNEELLKYYHQPADEVGSLDMEYLLKYTHSFVYATYMVANMKKNPFWTAGDKYEEAGKKLYGIP